MTQAPIGPWTARSGKRKRLTERIALATTMAASAAMGGCGPEQCSWTILETGLDLEGRVAEVIQVGLAVEGLPGPDRGLKVLRTFTHPQVQDGGLRFSSRLESRRVDCLQHRAMLRQTLFYSGMYGRGVLVRVETYALDVRPASVVDAAEGRLAAFACGTKTRGSVKMTEGLSSGRAMHPA